MYVYITYMYMYMYMYITYMYMYMYMYITYMYMYMYMYMVALLQDVDMCVFHGGPRWIDGMRIRGTDPKPG